jgi:hypothetical protein
LCANPGRADPAQEERAQGLFHRGVALAAEERWTEAERIFAESYELVPRASTAFNRALALYRLGRMKDTIATIDTFLGLSDAVKDESQRSAATELQARARAALATLIVRVEPARARLDVDGVAHAGTGATRVVTVDPGEHLLVVAHAGFVPERRQLGVGAAERQQVTITLRLEPPPAPAPAPAPPPPVAEATSGPEIAPWIVFGAGSALLAASAITGTAALRKDAAIDRQCTLPGGLCPETARGDQRDLETLVTVTDVLVVTGTVLTLTGAGWLWLTRDAPATVAARASSSGLYLGVEGRL